MKLKDKVVLITGSSNGIGRATALMFAKEGAKLVINYKTSKIDAEAVVNEIKALRTDSIAIQADVSNPGEVKKLFQKVLKTFGTVDILINNAGLAKAKTFLEITRDDLIENFDLNFFSVVYCSQEAAKIMKKSGKIINVVSTCGLQYTGCTTVLPYSTAKASVAHLTRTLAKILAPNITVNAVAPGFTLTRYWDGTSKKDEKELLESTYLKKWVMPEDIAQAFLYLATADSVTGEIIVVDAGYQLK